MLVVVVVVVPFLVPLTGGTLAAGTKNTTLSLIIVSDGHQLSRAACYTLNTREALQMLIQDDDLSQHLDITW